MEITKFDQKNPCVKIQNNGNEIYFLRHAQSLANIGHHHCLDAPLSDEGIEQAKKVEGCFDLVLCSPLRRTKETLHYSKIKYGELIIADNAREYIQNLSSCLPLEQRTSNGEFEEEDLKSFVFLWNRELVTDSLKKKI
jgi:hypothetical protein